MTAGLVLAVLALRAGLALRRARHGRGARRPSARRAHLRLAKPAVAVLVVGLLAGPPSAVVLRGWDPLRTLHGWLGLLVAGLFAAAFVLGRWLEQGRSRSFDVHGWLGLLAVLGAALTAIAGFVLLP
jgi:hypothetical protein